MEIIEKNYLIIYLLVRSFQKLVLTGHVYNIIEKENAIIFLTASKL